MVDLKLEAAVLAGHGQLVWQAVAILIPIIAIDDLPLAVAHAGQTAVGVEFKLRLTRQPLDPLRQSGDRNIPSGQLIDQRFGVLALVAIAVAVEQGDLPLAAGELQNAGANQAGEVEAIILAILLPVEAGAALLLWRDDGHLAG